MIRYTYHFIEGAIVLKKLLLPILLVSVASCDYEVNKHAKTFKWAAADKYKIQNAVDDNFKNNNPYSEDINKSKENSTRERNLTKEQISDLERAGEKKCKTSFLPVSSSGADPKASLRNAQTIVMADEPQIASIEDWQRARKAENSPEYQDCLANIKKDPLIADLKEKSQKLDDIYDAKRKHDDEVKKKLEKIIDSTIAAYAEKNGFDLIITNQSKDNILYSKDKAVLDVTADVIDVLQKSMAETKQQYPAP